MGMLDILIYMVYFVSIFVTVFYYVTYSLEKDKIKSKVAKKNLPFVSVIAPAYNEGEKVILSVESIKKLDYPQNKIEIVIVDDGSTDNTYEVAKSLVGKNIRAFTQKNKGKAAAVNLGIKKCKGELIVVLDADTMMKEDLLRRAVPYFRDDPSVGIVVPTLKPYKPKKLLEKIQLVEYVISAFNRKILSFIDSLPAASACSIFRASLFEKYGGFDEGNLTEDFEIALRTHKHGHRLVHLVDSYAHTYVPNTFKKLYRQRLRWGYGHFYNLKKHRLLFSSKYGDLGMFYLPLMLFTIGMAMLFLFIMAFNLLDKLYNAIHNLFLVDFNLVYTGIDILGTITDLRIVLGLFILGTALYLFRLAKKFTKEKRVNFITLFLFLLVYNFMITLVSVVALGHFMVGKKPRW